MTQPAKLTVVIPVRNEQEFLPACLESVAFADEILVLDSGSTDNSLFIARQAGARIHKYSWQGFKYAHELGVKLATNEWVLFVDADERVSAKLKQEILGAIQTGKKSAYLIKRLNYIMGQPLYHGGWYPDTMIRLFKKSQFICYQGELHEYPQVKGEVGQLEGDLYHLTHRSMEWKLQKSLAYTRANAQLMKEANHPPVRVRNFFGAMAREFYSRAIKHAGWKDGFVGWLEIIDQTFNAFLTQVFLWQLQRKQSLQQTYKQIDQQILKELKQ